MSYFLNVWDYNNELNLNSVTSGCYGVKFTWHIVSIRGNAGDISDMCT